MFHLPSTSKGWVGRIKKNNNQKIISKQYNSFKLKTFLFSLKIPKYGSVMFSLNGTLKKSGSVYWDGLNRKSTFETVFSDYQI